jgi:hypothetical protein
LIESVVYTTSNNCSIAKALFLRNYLSTLGATLAE